MACFSQLNLCQLPEKTPDNEDYEFTPEDGDTESRISSDDVPEFISTNQTYNAIAGRPFQIGCQVNKLDETQVCWVRVLILLGGCTVVKFVPFLPNLCILCLFFTKPHSISLRKISFAATP